MRQVDYYYSRVSIIMGGRLHTRSQAPSARTHGIWQTQKPTIFQGQRPIMPSITGLVLPKISPRQKMTYAYRGYLVVWLDPWREAVLDAGPDEA